MRHNHRGTRGAGSATAMLLARKGYRQRPKQNVRDGFSVRELVRDEDGTAVRIRGRAVELARQLRSTPASSSVPTGSTRWHPSKDKRPDVWQAANAGVRVLRLPGAAAD